MISELAKYFDEYSLNARVKPALFLILPIILSLLVLFEPTRSWEGSLLTFAIGFGVINFAANQMSTKGNELQDKLFKKWGGAPTTIILRHSDTTIDSFTKTRYMERLHSLIENFTPTTPEIEKQNPEHADNLYRTACNYMREHTRDIKKYPLVFKENISYGFSRNIRAFKPLGIFITLLSVISSSFVIYNDLSAENNISAIHLASEIPLEQIGLIIILLSILLGWVFLVTEKWVKVRGFAYAKRLYSVCEHIKD